MRIQRIAYLLVAFALAGGFPAFAKGQNESSAAGSSAPITVTFLTLSDIVDNLKPVAAAYQEQHPGVSVNFEGYPFDQMFQVIETKMAAHSGDVDLLNVDEPAIANYTVQGYLEPLDAYFTSADESQFVPAELTASMVQGKFMAAPLNSSSVGLYYNVKLFQQYGVEQPSLDPSQRWTWDQVVDAARKLTIRQNGVTTVWGFAFDQFSHPYQMLPLAQSLGGSGISPDGLKASGYVNATPWIKAGQWYQDLFQEWKVSPLGVPAFQSPQLFAEGKIAMILTGPWQVPLFNKAAGLEWKYAPHPYFAGGKIVTPTGSWHIGVSAYSGKKAAAADFVKYLTLSVGNAIYFKYQQNLPANRIVLETAENQANQQNDQVMKLAIYEATHTAVARPETPGYVAWEQIMYNAFENIRNGADVKQSLDAAAAKIDSVLSQYSR